MLTKCSSSGRSVHETCARSRRRRWKARILPPGEANTVRRPGHHGFVDRWVPDSLSSPLPVRRALPAGMQGAGSVDPTARPEPRRPPVSTWGSAGHGHPPRQLASGRHAAFHGARGRSHPSEMRARSRSTSRGVWVARLQNLPHRIGRPGVHRSDPRSKHVVNHRPPCPAEVVGAPGPPVAHSTVSGLTATGLCSGQVLSAMSSSLPMMRGAQIAGDPGSPAILFPTPITFFATIDEVSLSKPSMLIGLIRVVPRDLR